MRIIDKYTEAVTSEQTKLISYVKQMTAKISIPDAAVTTKVIKPARHNTVSVACITGGALALIAGLCLEKMVFLLSVVLLWLVAPESLQWIKEAKRDKLKGMFLTIR